MANFVHLTDDKTIETIRRSGIRLAKIHNNDYPAGIFCMPVTNDFFASHQWARELKRFGKKNLYGIYFRIKDDEPVWYGYYNAEHRHDNAVKAIHTFDKLENKMGFQVVIPRKIYANEIYKIKAVPLMGWRFYPTSKGRRPCLCPACIGRGEYDVNNMKEQHLEEYWKQLKHAKTEQERIYALNNIYTLMEIGIKLKEWESLFAPEFTESEGLLIALGNIIFSLKNDVALECYIKLLLNAPLKAQVWASWQIMYLKRKDGRKFLGELLNIPEVMDEVTEYEREDEND